MKIPDNLVVADAKQVFMKQLEKTKPLTAELIEKLSKPKRLGAVPGDKLLYMLVYSDPVDGGRRLTEIISVLDSEFNNLNEEYIFTMPTDTTLPRTFKRSEVVL